MELRTRRAVLSSVCVLACVLVVCYRGDIANTVSAFEEHGAIRESADTVIAETTTAESAEGASALTAKRDAMLESLTSFRAYSEIAYERAKFYYQNHKHGDTAMINVMVDFAESGVEAIKLAKKISAHDQTRKEKAVRSMSTHKAAVTAATTEALLDGPGSKIEAVKKLVDAAGCDEGKGDSWCVSMNKCVTTEETCPDMKRKFNVVVDLAKALRNAKAKFKVGVNKYLVDHLHSAIMSGKKIIVPYMYNDYGIACVGLNHKVLGLVDRPHYFKDICVPKAKYTLRLSEVRQASTHADVDAAAAWLLEGGKAEYKTFLETEEAEKAAKLKKFDDDKVAAALKTIKDEFKVEAEKPVEDDEKLDHTFTALHPLPDAGKSGAKTVEVPTVRSEAEIAEDAKKAEDEWMAKKKLAEPEEAEVDDVVEGVDPHPDEASPTTKSKGKIIPKIKATVKTTKTKIDASIDFDAAKAKGKVSKVKDKISGKVKGKIRL